MPARPDLCDSNGSTNSHLKAETMTFKRSMICALALSALAVSAAEAQTTRAAVKAEAAVAAANQPKGELSVANQDKGVRPMPSNTSRAAVKVEARRARAAGEIAVGEQSMPRQGSRPARRPASDKTRAQVRSEAVAANKSGVVSRGEASVVGQDKGGIRP